MISLKQTTPGGSETAAVTEADLSPPAYTDPLARLSSYRHAAQAIRRQDRSLGQRMARIIKLMQEARAEPDQFVREMAEAIVRAQGMWMLEGDEALDRIRTTGRLETAARKLRAEGFECCPMCEQRLSDAADWSFWTALRRAELDRLRALEGGEAA
jgi:hypothetical protein